MGSFMNARTLGSGFSFRTVQLPLKHHLPLELGDGSDDAKHHAAGCGVGVNPRAEYSNMPFACSLSAISTR
jgi:hypothetical protein